MKLLNVDASHLTEYFDDNEIDRVYSNFSDPRHSFHNSQETAYV